MPPRAECGLGGRPGAAALGALADGDDRLDDALLRRATATPRSRRRARWSSRSWISHATSGGSSSRSGLEHAVRWSSNRAASSGSSRASASVATAAFASLSSRRPSAASETTAVRDVGARGLAVGGVASACRPRRSVIAARCAALRNGCAALRVVREQRPVRVLEARARWRGRRDDDRPARCVRRPSRSRLPSVWAMDVIGRSPSIGSPRSETVPRRARPSFRLSCHASSASRGYTAFADSVLDRRDDAVRVVPLLVDSHAGRRAVRRFLADEDDGRLGPARTRDVRDPEALGRRAPASITTTSARLAARGIRRAPGRHARDDADALAVEEEADELHVPLVASRRGRPRRGARLRGQPPRPAGAASSAARAAHATRSPSARPRRSHSPARSSTTSRAPRHEAVLNDCRLGTILTTIWSASRKTTSIGNRMNAVWIDQAGRRRTPWPDGQVALAEQAAQPAARRVGDGDGLRDDAAVLAAQREVRDGAHAARLASRARP